MEPTDYLNYLRMDEIVYLKLFSMVTPLIQKNTIIRTAKYFSTRKTYSNSLNIFFRVKLSPYNIYIPSTESGARGIGSCHLGLCLLCFTFNFEFIILFCILIFIVRLYFLMWSLCVYAFVYLSFTFILSYMIFEFLYFNISRVYFIKYFYIFTFSDFYLSTAKYFSLYSLWPQGVPRPNKTD